MIVCGLALITTAALAARAAVAVYWQRHWNGRFGFGDSEGYFDLGRAIAEGRPYELAPSGARVFRTPGYPLLLAPVFWVSGGTHAVLLARLESARHDR